MLDTYLPIMVLLGVAIGFAVASATLSGIIGMKKPTEVKLAPYECGMPPIGTARERFPVKFYIIAMLFIVFDIETVFLYPWAVMFKKLGLFGFAEMGVFIVILLVGYIYVWRKGALEWE